MNVLAILRRWRGPTLVVQVVALLLGGLIIAQAVTLLLTLLLPPAPTPRYDLRSVAAALHIDAEARDGGLQHNIQPGPPELGGRGWLTSERSRAELALLLGANIDDVRLSFYTPLPFAGTVGAYELAMANDAPFVPADARKLSSADHSATPVQPNPSAQTGAPAKRVEPTIPLVPRERGLFGLAPVPFVEGDFVAALRLPDGRWSVIQLAPEPFPNSWQRRILLWFVIAFAIVAPIGWLFARRVVKPLVRFAEAAEQLGRDPTASVLNLDGPAEVGRAANAFNIMQSRVKSFVGDRTAMIGAISHDLRTPLTRLRFRIEEVDNEASRDGMIEEVEEMEAMITSVLTFIRDAAAPGVREKLDLRTILEDVAEDALMIGGDVSIGMMQPAPVEVDVMGMRRLLGNLIENALKYGGRAHLRLSVEHGEAVAEIIDEGPGVPEEDLERAFEPFYRAANAKPEQRGSGLGLAVCRSIARAHGGDVRLVRAADGFRAQLRLPLAFGADDVIAV